MWFCKCDLKNYIFCCQMVFCTYAVELVNSQVVFKGTDTKGAVIVTASTAEVKGCRHCPQYKGGELVVKTSLVASLGKMQVRASNMCVVYVWCYLVLFSILPLLMGALKSPWIHFSGYLQASSLIWK